MATMARETWADERLDDLNRRVGDGFREQREDTRALREEMTRGHESLRAEIKAGDEALRGEFGRLGDRLDRLQLMMIGSLATMVATLLAVVLGIVVDKL